MLNRFDNVIGWEFARADGTLCKCQPGPILSGEKLVDEADFKAALFHRFPQAIGGEMEGSGLCATAIRCHVPWILVKAICDWGDGKKHKKFQPLAAAAATSLGHHVLSSPTALHGLEKRQTSPDAGPGPRGGDPPASSATRPRHQSRRARARDPQPGGTDPSITSDDEPTEESWRVAFQLMKTLEWQPAPTSAVPL